MNVKINCTHKLFFRLILMILSSNWLALKSKVATEPMKRPRKEIADSEHVRKVQKTQYTEYIAMDCEMVEGESVEHMLARVSLVDYAGRAVYDAYVKPRETVIDYRTSITGLSKEILARRGEQFSKVRQRVLDLIKDKIVVGHAVHHDFEALNIPFPAPSHIRDTCLYSKLRPPKRKTTPSLRLLADYWLDKKVQTDSHSSVEDARTAMMLYKRFQNEWEDSLKSIS